MRRGLFLPIFDELADPVLLGELAAEAEAAGWDGVFVWDHVLYRPPVMEVTDPWVALTCIAMRTSRVLIGPMVTPVARRRPHVLARQSAAVDQVSAGRLVLGVGLGLDASGGELSRFGEETDDRIRATMLDEALGVIAGLLTGETIDHDGAHYTARDVQFLPAPAGGRVPIWVAGRYPNKRPLQRAARHDGLFVIDIADPGQLVDVVATMTELRDDMDGFDVVVQTPAEAGADGWDDAGATWWLAAFDPFTVTVDAVRAAIGG